MFSCYAQLQYTLQRAAEKQSAGESKATKAELLNKHSLTTQARLIKLSLEVRGVVGYMSLWFETKELFLDSVSVTYKRESDSQIAPPPWGNQFHFT